MSSAYHFFLQHTGYGYDPKTETPIEGRRRCAQELAKAERDGTELGLVAEWEEDPDADPSFLDQEGYTEDDREHARFWSCTVHDGEGTVLASLGSIHEDVRLDGFRNYRRVVRAELFAEVLTLWNGTSFDGEVPQ